MGKKKKSQKRKNVNKKTNTQKISQANKKNEVIKNQKNLNKEKSIKVQNKKVEPSSPKTTNNKNKIKNSQNQQSSEINKNVLSTSKQLEKDCSQKCFKDKKSKLFLGLAIFILCFSALSLIISTTHILKWKKENKEIKNQTEKIQKVTKVEREKEPENNENMEVIETEDKVQKENPYWDYTKTNIKNVDFKSLKKINEQTVGWIQVKGTNINYPFVQTTDNDYYLTHSFQKTKNSAGWVFMDYRNNILDFNKNTILYAHGRLDNTMFGSLRNILNNNWINDPNNYIIQLSTETENTFWQVFSVYQIPTTNDYLQVRFSNAEAFLKFTEKLISRSNYDFNTAIEKSDKILTLSTCYDDTDKMVLHAKLIKREIR